MRKRMTSLLLTLVMLLSLVPAMGVTASAAELTTVNSYEELQTAVKAKKEYIQLGRNIDTKDFHYSGGGLDIADWLTFENQTCTLDLNGKTLSLLTRMGDMPTFMRVYEGSNLTIKDSQGGGQITGEFENANAGDRYLIHMNKSSLTLEGGTFRATAKPYGTNVNVIDYLESNVTIKDGVTISQPEHYAYGGGGSGLKGHGYALCEQQREFNYGDEVSHVVIDGGIFDGWVRLIGYPDTNGSVQINGGTFKKGVQVLYVAKKNNSDPTVTVNRGTFEDNVYFQDWDWKESLYMPYRLNGGIFKGTVDLHTVNNITVYQKPESNPNVALGLNECFGYSAVVTPDGTFVGPNAYTGVLKKTGDYDYDMWLEGTASNPVRIIPNAWGMKSVTLNGNPINYAKDWYGEAKQEDNSTAHTLKFEWYPLAQELKDAGYSYRTKCEHYFSGSTAVQQTDTIDASKTSHTITIEIGADPKVYSYDLQLNLDKNSSSVGIMGNEHIVKLVVNPAPVVTEITSAPVRLSAALTPGTSAPSATAVGSGYTVDSIKWYTNNECTTEASSFVAGTKYYGKIVLKPKTNYKFAASASALLFCDDPNENYAGISSTVAEDGSSLTRIVKGTAVSALKWETVNKDDKTYTIGDSALTLNAKATGGESGKPITYKLIAKKDGTETVKASAMVAAFSTDSFSASLSFTDIGSYECWFEATRGGVTITSDHFTVTVNAPGLSIANQSGDLTVEQNGSARLFVKAVGHGVKYEWQVKNDGTWEAISGETAYDYAASTATAGEKTYRCVVTDKYGATRNSEEMTVTVKEGADTTLTPAIPLAAVNGDAPDPTQKWPDKNVPNIGWQGLPAEYDVTADETFHGVATFSTIPTGFNMNGHDIYSIAGVQKTPVLGDISYEWKAAATEPWLAAGGAIAVLSTEKSANITIPSGVTTYYAQLKVMNTVGTDTETSTVEITFHVSPAHTAHSYAYAQLDDNQHTKYCTACADSSTEPHTMDTTSGMCTLCSYAPATYSVNVTDGSADHSTNVAPGTKVTLTANPASTGQEFDKWVGNVNVTGNTFNMPSHNVTVAATYKPKAHAHDTDAQPWVYMDPGTHIKTCTAGDDFKVEAHTWQWVVDAPATSTTAGSKHEKCTKCTATRNANTVIPATGGGSSSGGGGGGGGSYTPSYTVSVDKTENGTITVSPKSASKGDTVTITVKPDKGYELEMLKALDKDGDALKLTEKNGKYTFTMPSGKVTIKGSFVEEAPVQIFKDVPVDAYYYEAVKWAAEKGITGGVGNGLFAPNQPCTRAQIVTFLWRAAGSPAPKNMSSFTDVPADAFYAKAVAWAVENGITGGTGDGKFSPDATCTRAQSVTFLYRAAGSPKVSGSAEFGDVASNAYYADAVAWAAKNDITGGIGGGLFGSDNDCTRAQIVTFLYRSVK